MSDLESCLALLDFPESELEEFFGRPPLSTPQGESVPLAYIRDRLATLSLEPERDADYTILVYGSEEDLLIGRYGMHEAVWISQCMMVMPIASNRTDRLCRVQEPVNEAIATFLRWLYTNDEEELYDALREGMTHSQTFPLSFCTLIRVSICVNYKIQAVIRAVYEQSC
jgi:hypothetical protein